MASPHVAGTVALLFAENPSLTSDEVRCYLEATARDRGPLGWDSNYGWGALDARAALNALLTGSVRLCPKIPVTGGSRREALLGESNQVMSKITT